MASKAPKSIKNKTTTEDLQAPIRRRYGEDDAEMPRTSVRRDLDEDPTHEAGGRGGRLVNPDREYNERVTGT